MFELETAREFVAWYAEALRTSRPDEPFDPAAVDVASVVTILRHKTIGGSLERMKRAAELYLAEHHAGGHPIDQMPPKVLSDDQERSRMEFSSWWKSVEWPKWHDYHEYEFGAADASMVLKCLRYRLVKWDLEKLKNVARVYLADPEIYGNFGHPLTRFRQKLDYYCRLWERRQREGTSHLIGLASTSGGAPRPASPAPERSGDRVARLLAERHQRKENTA